MATTDHINTFVRTLKSQGVRYVRFELPDLHGISRAKVVPIDKVEGYARKGLNLYGGAIGLDTASNVVGGTGLNEEVKYRDQTLIPDLSTVQRVPWLEATAKVVCDAQWAPGNPIEATPRQVLRRLLDAAAAMGYEVLMGHEFEFYLLDGATRQPLFGGVHIFNNVRNQYVPFLDTLLDQLQGAGVDVITHNCEYAPSQFEINFGPGLGLAGADKAFTFKNAVKELAHRAGYLATFMSKPATDRAGCGCHVHMSLLDRKTRKSVFHDPRVKGGRIPATLASFTQGILAHARGLAPLIGPTPNCYRRLKPHTFAPSNVGWGLEDRSAMVRIKDLGTDNAHVEMRAASGMSNPYVTAAGVLACGLLGLSGKLPLAPEVSGPCEDDPTLPKLPRTLDEALDALAADAELADMLGKDFVHVFTTVKRYELQRFHDHVTDWERNEYLEVY